MISISFQENFVMTRAYPDRKKYPACLLLKGEVDRAFSKKDLKKILETRIVVDSKGREHPLSYHHAYALQKNMKKIGMKTKEIGLSYKIILRHTAVKKDIDLSYSTSTKLNSALSHYLSLGYEELEEIKDKDCHKHILKRKYPVNTSGVPQQYFKRNTIAKLLKSIERKVSTLPEGKVYTSEYSADKGYLNKGDTPHFYTYTLERNRICIGVI